MSLEVNKTCSLRKEMKIRRLTLSKGIRLFFFFFFGLFRGHKTLKALHQGYKSSKLE